MDRMLDRLSTALTCVACASTVRDPRLLPCLHSFCQECILHRLSRSSTPSTQDPEESDSRRVAVTCPLDREVCHCQRSLLSSSLPVDQYKAQLLQDLEVTCGPGSVATCAECAEEEPAQWFCPQCHVLLCDLHSQGHRKSLAGKSHDQWRLDEVVQKARERGFTASHFMASTVPLAFALTCHRPVSLCTVHHKEPVVMYCRDCEVALCRDCSFEHSQAGTHRIDRLSTVYSLEKKQQYETLVARTVDRLKVHRKGADLLCEQLEELDSQQQRAIHDVHQQFTVLMEWINSRKQKLEEEVTKAYADKSTRLRQQFVDVSEATSALYSGVRMSEASADVEDYDRFFQEVKRIQQLLQEKEKLLGKDPGNEIVPGADATLLWTVPSSALQDLAERIRSLGRIVPVAVSVEHSRCLGTASSSGGTAKAQVSKPVCVGQSYSFLVELCDERGRRVRDPSLDSGEEKTLEDFGLSLQLQRIFPDTGSAELVGGCSVQQGIAYVVSRPFVVEGRYEFTLSQQQQMGALKSICTIEVLPFALDRSSLTQSLLSVGDHDLSVTHQGPANTQASVLGRWTPSDSGQELPAMWCVRVDGRPLSVMAKPLYAGVIPRGSYNGATDSGLAVACRLLLMGSVYDSSTSMAPSSPSHKTGGDTSSGLDVMAGDLIVFQWVAENRSVSVTNMRTMRSVVLRNVPQHQPLCPYFMLSNPNDCITVVPVP